MTIQTRREFDPGAFKRAYETWDLPAILAQYAPDAELIQITADNPPSNPRVQRGHDTFRQMFEHGKAAGVTVTVEALMVGDGHAAGTFTCTFPDGRAVTANAIFDLADGLVVRDHEVLVGG